MVSSAALATPAAVAAGGLGGTQVIRDCIYDRQHCPIEGGVYTPPTSGDDSGYSVVIDTLGSPYVLSDDGDDVYIRASFALYRRPSESYYQAGLQGLYKVDGGGRLTLVDADPQNGSMVVDDGGGVLAWRREGSTVRVRQGGDEFDLAGDLALNGVGADGSILVGSDEALVPGLTPGVNRPFIYRGGTPELAALGHDGLPAPSGGSPLGRSADGSLVLIRGRASEYIAGAPVKDAILLVDVVSDTVTPVSVDAAGAYVTIPSPGNGGTYIDPDGTEVLVDLQGKAAATDTNNAIDTYLFEIATGDLRPVALTPANTTYPAGSGARAMSNDGFVVRLTGTPSSIGTPGTLRFGTEPGAITALFEQDDRTLTVTLSPDGSRVYFVTPSIVPVDPSWRLHGSELFVKATRGVDPSSMDVAALGDSFSSGEGAPAPHLLPVAGFRGYLLPTDFYGVDQCHRSTQAYPWLLAEALGVDIDASFEFRACSGAKAHNVLHGGQWLLEGPQVDGADQNTDFLTIGIGGNDFGFLHVLATCAVVGGCNSLLGTVEMLWPWMDNKRDDLVDLFGQLRSQHIDQDGSIAVMGYPQMFPDPADGPLPTCLSPLFDDAEVEWLRAQTTHANDIIRSAAAEAGVHFVPVDSAFEDADALLCSSQPALNGLVLSPFSETLHPNAFGHQLLERELEGFRVDGLPVWAAGLPDPIPGGGGGGSWFTADEPAALEVDSLDIGIVDGSGEPSEVVLPGGDLTMRGTGFAPGSTVTSRLHPEDATLVTAQADEQGSIEVDVTLPSDTALGTHAIVTEGTSASGGRRLLTGLVAVAGVPAAPLPLTAAAGDGRVELTWGTPSTDNGKPVLGFQVYRDGELVHQSTDPGARTFADETVANGESYAYTVTAVNAAGQGPPAGPARASPRAPDGRIAGTVQEVGAGSPVGGTWVAVLRAADFTLVAGTEADDAGQFEVAVPAGSYHLYLVDPAAAHAPGFHGPPSEIAVSSGATTSVDPQIRAARGSIVGTVTDEFSGAPVDGAWGLALSASMANAGATEVIVDADASGGFTLPGLLAGRHYVGFVDPAGEHETRFYPTSPNVPDATPVMVDAGETTAADAALPPQSPVGGGAAVTGTITDEVTGAAVPHGRVVALRAADYRMVRAATAGSDGTYRLDIAPGAYILAFLDAAGAHAMEWFDNQPSTGLATATTITAPRTANAALSPTTGAIAGTVTADAPTAPLAGAWVIAIGPTGVAGGALAAADGTYTIDGLAPGTYRVTFVDPSGDRAQEFWDNSLDYGGAVAVPVTAGATTTRSATLGTAAADAPRRPSG